MSTNPYITLRNSISSGQQYSVSDLLNSEAYTSGKASRTTPYWQKIYQSIEDWANSNNLQNHLINSLHAFEQFNVAAGQVFNPEARGSYSLSSTSPGQWSSWFTTPATQENPILFKAGDSLSDVLDYAKNTLGISDSVYNAYSNFIEQRKNNTYTSVFDPTKSFNKSGYTGLLGKDLTQSDLANQDLWTLDSNGRFANTGLLNALTSSYGQEGAFYDLVGDMQAHGWNPYYSPYSFSSDDNNLFGYKYDDATKTASYLDVGDLKKYSADYQWAKFLKDFGTLSPSTSTSIPLALSAVTGIEGALSSQNIPEYLQSYLQSVFAPNSSDPNKTKLEYLPFTTSGGVNDYLGHANTNEGTADFYSWGDTPLSLDKSLDKYAKDSSLKRVSFGTISDDVWDRLSELFGFTNSSLYSENAYNELLNGKLYFSDIETPGRSFYDVGTRKYYDGLATNAPGDAGIWTAPMTQYNGGLESLLSLPAVTYNGKLLGSNLLESGVSISSEAGTASGQAFKNDPYILADPFSSGNATNQSLGYGSLSPSALFAKDSKIFNDVQTLWNAQATEAQKAFVDDTNLAGMGLSLAVLSAGLGAGLGIQNPFLNNLVSNSLGQGLNSLLTGADFDFGNILINSGVGALSPTVSGAISDIVPDTGLDVIDKAIAGGAENVLGSVITGDPSGIISGAIGGGILGGLQDLGVPGMIDSIIDSVRGSSTTGSTEGLDISGWGLDNGGSLSGSDDWGDVIDTITSTPEVKIPNISIEDAWNSGVGSINTGGVGLTVPTTPTIPDSSMIPITDIPVTSTQGNNMWDFDSWWNEGITSVLGGISSEGLSFDPSNYSTSLNLLNTLGAGITGVGNYTNPNISLGDPSSYINTVLGNLSSGNLSNYTIPTTGSNGSPLSQGVTSALSKLLEGGINKFMQDPVKNALTVYSGLTSASDQEEFAKQLQNLMSSGLQQSDPFGPQRAQYAQRLARTYTNPEEYLTSPEYKAISKRRLEALERADAAQGRRSQYGARAEKMHEFDLENLMKERTMLAQLAGSGISPSQVSSLINGVGVGSAQAQANAPGNLLFMLNQIFGGK